MLEQLQEAFERTQWSVQQLLERSGLAIDRSVLARKMKGLIPTTLIEAQALAEALGITIRWPPRAGKKAA